MKLNEIGRVVSDKKPFENVDRQLACDLWPMSPNDLDLQNFIMAQSEYRIVPKNTIGTKKCTF